MKKYKVNVNGTMYEITLEVVEADEVKNESAPAPAPKAAPAAAPAGGTQVTAPMPGNILAVNFQNGQNVKKGDVLFILEAMKMENEIYAPCSGSVAQVLVTKGQSVDTGAPLVTIS